LPNAERLKNRLKLRDLDVLLAVVDTGSMGKAVGRLGVSQPAISKAIADLERALGVRLLDRSRQGVEPTAYGRALVKRGIAMFDELRQGIEDIGFLADPTAGQLRIGASEVVARSIVAQAIIQLSRNHPRMDFHVMIGDSAPLNRLLEERKIELAIARLTDPIGPGFATTPLFEDSNFVATGPGSQWLKRSRIDLAELMNEPWVQIQPDSFFGSQVAETFRASGLALPRQAVTTPSLMLRDELMRTGRFLTMVGRLSLGFPPIHPLPVKLVSPPMRIGITVLKNRSLSPLGELFVETIRKIGKPLAGRLPAAPKRR
jgi:DNA-binding transcriptional LysR family regulator